VLTRSLHIRSRHSSSNSDRSVSAFSKWPNNRPSGHTKPRSE